MKKLFGFILFLLPMHAWCDATFTSLCVGEESIGFAWENKEWKATKFKAEKHLIEKVDPQNRLCRVKMQRVDSAPMDLGKDEDGVSRYVTKACFLIREMGSPRYEFAMEVCSQFWSKKLKGAETLEMVGCAYTNFEPDGDFTMGKISGDLRDEQDYKDSLSLSVGKCSTI